MQQPTYPEVSEELNRGEDMNYTSGCLEEIDEVVDTAPLTAYGHLCGPLGYVQGPDHKFGNVKDRRQADVCEIASSIVYWRYRRHVAEIRYVVSLSTCDIQSHLVSSQATHSKAFVQNAAHKDGRLDVGSVVLEPGKSQAFTTIEDARWDSLSRLSFEFGRGKTTDATLNSCFDETKLWLAGHC